MVLDPADDSGWAVFSRVLDDRTVTLEVVDGSLRDAETGTSFDPTRGAALEGALVGQNLDLLPGSTSFPEDVRTFWPEARFWPPSIVE